MKERVRVRVRKEEAAPTNRLTGITVNEVSIVERAANKRNFLVVKADPPPAAPPAVPAPAPPQVPQLKISPELKAKVSGALKAAAEKIAMLAKALETAIETPGAAAPQEVLDALAGISGLLAATPSQQPPAPPVAPPANKEEAMKAGRKMSAARLEQLTAAKATLDAILAEVTGDDESDDDDKSKTAKNAEPAATPPAPSQVDGLGEIRASIEQLAGMVGKMTLVFEGQNKRIDEIAKARGSSQQLDLDTPPASPERVTWDMDMAKPQKVVQ